VSLSRQIAALRLWRELGPDSNLLAPHLPNADII
jgi:hypothetical protein